MTIEIDNLTTAQAIALEDMLATWAHLASLGSSRWTAFFADGDGNFQPKITVDGQRPEFTNLISNEERWDGEEYRIDFDTIAWRLRSRLPRAAGTKERHERHQG